MSRHHVHLSETKETAFNLGSGRGKQLFLLFMLNKCLRNEVKRNKNYRPPHSYGWECLNVYYNRLQQDGWKVIESSKKAYLNSETIFEKQLYKQWILQKICHEQIGSPPGKGCYLDEHIVYNKTGKLLVYPDWKWAEWLDNSIYYAEKGCLY